jgi:hypothetical protein
VELFEKVAMSKRRLFVFCDDASGDFSLFSSGLQPTQSILRLDNFSTYFFVSRLDHPGFPFYAVLVKTPGLHTYATKFTFQSGTPDFTSLGLQTQDTSTGTVIYLSDQAFSTLESREPAFRLPSACWTAVKREFHGIAALKSLGIVPELTADTFTTASIKELSTKFNQIYGLYGSLSEGLATTFLRIRFAVHTFCIPEVATVIDQNFDLDEFYFSPLLPILAKIPQIAEIRRLLPFATAVDSPFLVLVDYIRVIFDALRAFDASLTTIDDHAAFVQSLHRFQRKSGFSPGDCDLRTAERLLSESKMVSGTPLPLFTMAEIPLRVRREPYFPQIAPIAAPEKEGEEVETLRRGLNDIVAGLADPAAKVAWLRGEIEREGAENAERCEGFRVRMAAVEQRMAAIANRVKELSAKSRETVEQVEAAAAALAKVDERHRSIHVRYARLREELRQGQRYAAILMVIAVFFAFFALVRFVWHPGGT